MQQHLAFGSTSVWCSIKMVLLILTVLCVVISASQIQAQDDSVRPVPPLCLVCKCSDNPTFSKQVDILCSEHVHEIELTRSDSWPDAVRSFSLTNAQLSTLPRLPSTNNLQYMNSLSLSHNALETLPDDAFNNFNLKQLDLSFNGLKELTESNLNGIEDLEILRLQHNIFSNVNWQIINKLQHLQELYFQDNYIKTLEGTTDLKELKVLNMSGNELVEIPKETCLGLPVIQTILLADNRLEGVPSCLLNLQELRELVLDGNQLTQVADSAFYTLTKLQTLGLSRLVQLEKVDGGALKGLKNLQSFRLSHNPRLTSIHRSLLLGEDAAQHHWSFTEVDLSYNALTSIPKDLAPWDIIEWLDLQGNPWHCSCDAKWMVDTLVPALYSKNSTQLVEVRCATPERFAGRRMVHWLDYKTDPMPWCSSDSQPAPLQTEVKVQTGSSHGMLIALTVVAVAGVVLIVVGVVLQRRYTRQRKEMATIMGRCRNPRNGSVRLTNPKLGI
ncbi:hypothetical protein B566_EDAN001805 [Ephemera danica]|nr:hypothetical protein B566_EDAN001805 [Ephemera danica]